MRAMKSSCGWTPLHGVWVQLEQDAQPRASVTILSGQRKGKGESEQMKTILNAGS